MARDDLLDVNAGIVKNLMTGCVHACPNKNQNNDIKVIILDSIDHTNNFFGGFIPNEQIKFMDILKEALKQEILKEAIKEVKKIFFKVLEDEHLLKETLQKRVDENTAIMDATRARQFGEMGALET